MDYIGLALDSFFHRNLEIMLLFLWRHTYKEDPAKEGVKISTGPAAAASKTQQSNFGLKSINQ